MRFSVPFSLLLMSTLFGACTFAPAEPWAEVSFSLESGIDIPDSRLDEGDLKTSSDYRVQMNNIGIDFDLLEVFSGDVEALSFDLANPPPGFSLCHNGHCHSDDGDLVPYREVEATLTGEVNDTAISLQLASSETIELGRFTNIELPPCASCSVGKGNLARLSLDIVRVRMSGVVYDATDAERVIGEQAFEIELEVLAGPLVDIDHNVGPFSESAFELALTYAPNIGLIDIDWAEFFENGLSEEDRFHILETLTDPETLEVKVSQTNP